MTTPFDFQAEYEETIARECDEMAADAGATVFDRRYEGGELPANAKARPGRPSLSADEPTVMLTARVTLTQRNVFLSLGGSAWLREQLDYANTVGNRLFSS